MQGRTADMPELVRIAHDIDRSDLALLDLERGCLQRIIGLDGHEARQAVDVAVAHEARHVLGENAREGGMQLHDIVEADNRLYRRRLLAAAVGMQGYVGRE